MRRSVGRETRRVAAERLADMTLDHCRSADVISPPARIGIYIAADGEISPDRIGDEFNTIGWSIWVPVVEAGSHMTFAPLGVGEELTPNRFGIPEPVAPIDRIHATDLEIVVVPCVAMDHSGNRLGMGAGFYDRALSAASGVSGGSAVPSSRPLRIGVGFDFQLVDRLDPDPWDIPMDVVITDERVVVPADSSI